MKKLATFLFTAAAVFLLSLSAAAANSSVIPTKTLNKALDAYRNALKNGDSYVDLSDLNISGSDEYYELYGYFIRANGDLGSISYGKYSETYVTTDIQRTGTGGAITGVKLNYGERYSKSDGSCDTDLVKQDQKLVSDRFNKMKASVKRNMSDAEKALFLYDLVITAAKYPEPEGTNEFGDEQYPNEVYTAVGLIRDGYAVCAAYAKLYAILLNEAGVPAITVDNEEIDHEWVMVQIDGNWYHCDPTWDDMLFDDEGTALWDRNNDIWDIGAVNHYYFLKSDEEFKELEHPDWDISYSVNPDLIERVPKSGPSGAFDDKFFSDKNNDYLTVSAMNYINGNWYFTDMRSASVIATSYDGEPESFEIPNSEMPKYSFGFNNYLYVCTNDSIYRFDTISNSFNRIMEIPADKANTETFSEMCILYDEMTLITASYTFGSDDEITDVSFDEEVFPMDVVENMDAIADPEGENETASRSGDDTDRIPEITRPGGQSDTVNQNSEDKEMLEAAQAAGKRVSAFIYLGLAAILLVFGVVAIVLAIKYSKKR